MAIPLSRVHAIRAILNMAREDWRSVVLDIPEVLRVSEEDVSPQVVWLTDSVEHVSGVEPTVIYRDYLSGKCYSTGSALTGGPVKSATLRTELPNWAHPVHNRRNDSSGSGVTD